MDRAGGVPQAVAAAAGNGDQVIRFIVSWPASSMKWLDCTNMPLDPQAGSNTMP